MKNLKKLVFFNLKWFFLCFEIWQNWPYHQNEMKKVWIFIFESLNENFHFEIWKRIIHTTREKWKKPKHFVCATKKILKQKI
jgi:hypothetical protein